MADPSQALSLGVVNLKPGIFRVSRWVPYFNPVVQRQTNTQIWVRIYDLPIEYWRPSMLFSIPRGTGLPLKIDEKTSAIEHGLFARVLVEIDLAGSLPERILVKRRRLNFFVNITYEKLPYFCTYCSSIGHSIEACKGGGSQQREGQKEQRTSTYAREYGGEQEHTEPTS